MTGPTQIPTSICVHTKIMYLCILKLSQQLKLSASLLECFISIYNCSFSRFILFSPFHVYLPAFIFYTTTIFIFLVVYFRIIKLTCFLFFIVFIVFFQVLWNLYMTFSIFLQISTLERFSDFVPSEYVYI